MATEKRLIDANELKKKAKMNGYAFRPMVTNYHQCVTVRDIDNAPTVDAVEVVHGRWLETEVEAGDPFDGNSVYCFDVFACSECGCHFDVSEVMNYCPNCGAKMDGDGND